MAGAKGPYCSGGCGKRVSINKIPRCPKCGGVLCHKCTCPRRCFGKDVIAEEVPRAVAAEEAPRLRAALEKYIDEMLDGMAKRAPMYGPAIVIDCQGMLLTDLYERFCRTGAPRPIRPCDDLYQRFMRTKYPKKPGPLCLADWLLSKGDSEKDAGTKVAEFYIAWKAHLATV